MRIFSFVLTILISGICFSQDSLSLLFIGDVMQHDVQIQGAFNPKTKAYEYDSCFKYISETISSVDVAIANLEFTLGGKPYAGYPMFSAPDEMGVALKNAGVDVLVTANNHTCDRRKKGVIRTLDVLDSLDIPHTGSFRNKAERDLFYPLLIERNGFRLALLNYTYGTNGMPIESPTMVNLIEHDQIKKDLQRAKEMDVDKIIVFMHWGSEYTNKANSAQIATAKMLFENGADLVIGAHPHVLQPMYYESKDTIDTALVYSLGNFISNQRTTGRDGGAMFRISLVREKGEVRLVNPGYQLTWVWVDSRAGRSHFFVLPAAQYEEVPLLDAASKAKMKTYLSGARKLLITENQNVPEYVWRDSGWKLKE